MNSNVNIKCMICKKRFPEPLFNVHQCSRSGAESYECEICKKTFTENGILTKHKRVHTGEKPYECEICKKKFSTTSSLIVHKRLDHVMYVRNYMHKILHYFNIIKLLLILKE